MSDDKKKDDIVPSEPSEEEKKEEEQALLEAKEEEINAQVIKDFNLNEEDDADLIGKITKERLEGKKKLSTAIRQKIEHRTKRATAEKALEEKGQSPEDDEKKDIKKDEEEKEEKKLDKKLDAREKKRDLKALKVSEELTKEIDSYATLHDVSIQEALDSPYIQYRKKEEDDKKATDDAAIEGDDKTKPITGLSTMSEEKLREQLAGCDGSTEEGQKKFDKIKVELKRREES